MGLTERLARAAARRPRVLLVPVPGQRPLRWAAEDALDALGWARAASPAGADLLLCCGAPGPELSEHVDVAWDGMPGPRTRTQVTDAATGRGDLAWSPPAIWRTWRSSAGTRRRDPHRHCPPPTGRTSRRRATTRTPAQGCPQDSDRDLDADDKDMDHGSDMDMDMSGGDMDMDMSGGMDMDMDMDLPGGLVMADRVEDRDGLRLEGLRLSLGPLLPTWPAGLRLDVVLSGDVLTRADVVRLDPRPEPPAPTVLLALDALALLLEAAGWSDGALRARRARREGGLGPVTEDLLRRLGRARLLRWSLRGLPGPSGGDLVTHLDRLVGAVQGRNDLPRADDDELGRAVVGLDVGTAALVVAAHAPLLPVAVDA